LGLIPVIMYVVGLGVFGFAGWVMNGIKAILLDAGIHETGTTFDFMLYIWAGCTIIYLIFGGLWVIKKYNEENYQYGGL